MMLSNILDIADIPSSHVTATKIYNVQLKQLREKYRLEKKSRRGFAKLSMLTSHWAKKAQHIANLALYNYQSICR